MKAALFLLVGVAALSLLVLWLGEGKKAGANSIQSGVRDEASPEEFEAVVKARSPVVIGSGADEVPIAPDGVSQAPTSVVVAVPSVPGISIDDVNEIRTNLDNLYANASRDDLIQGYKNGLAMLPEGLLSQLHKTHVEAGRYEVLDVPLVKKGANYRLPNVKASPLAHGLVRVNILDDGRSVKTELELNELGRHAALAVELGWFELAIGRAR